METYYQLDDKLLQFSAKLYTQGGLLVRRLRLLLLVLHFNRFRSLPMLDILKSRNNLTFSFRDVSLWAKQGSDFAAFKTKRTRSFCTFSYYTSNFKYDMFFNNKIRNELQISKFLFLMKFCYEIYFLCQFLSSETAPRIIMNFFVYVQWV